LHAARLAAGVIRDQRHKPADIAGLPGISARWSYGMRFAPKLLDKGRFMNTQAIAALPQEITPPPARLPDPASASSFSALLAPTSAPNGAAEPGRGFAAPAKTDARTAAGDARWHRTPGDKDKKSPAASDASAGAAAPQAALPASLQASAPSTAAGATAAADASTPSAPVLAQMLLAPAPPTAAIIDPSGSSGPSPASLPSAGAGTATSPPAAPANAAPNSATPFAAMAAELGLRIAAAAASPALSSQPRVALADLSPQDKLASAAAPSAAHSPLSLEALQGLAKSPAPAPIDEKLLADAGKDIAAATASLEHSPGDDGSAQPATSTTAAATGPALDVSSSPAMAPPPAPPIAAAPAPLSPTTLRAAEQVALALPQAVKSGDNHIQIQLQPAELGGIDVKLSVNHDGRVTMVVSADRGDTLNLLRQDASTLTQALRDAGLQADNSSLSFNLRGGFSFNQQAFQGGTASGGGTSSADPEIATIAAPPAALQRRHAGALDIHV
jgi:flagellar hook-length control protein FliK